jgi:myo-inositol-1(or 4)-monophosphatase
MKNEHIPDKQVLSGLLEKAVKAAIAPADKILSYFRNPNLSIQSKDDGSPVTLADQEAEEMIREMLASDTSIGKMDILGEEHGLNGSGTPLRWTIDPIDGTRSFVQGIPLFGTIVALEDTVNHQALLGVIHLPMFNKTYYAARGLGSWCNNAPLTISMAARPDKAIIAVGAPLQFSNGKLLDSYQRLCELCPCLRGYTDCFGHTLVASGAVAAMMDPTLNPWDIMATQVLIEEGGGSLLIRPSAAKGKVDALFGSPDLVTFLSEELHFME